MCVFVCVVCCIQTDVVKERERTEEERRRRRRRSSRQQERREEKSSRRGQHVATSTVDHHQIQKTEQIAKCNTNAPRVKRGTIFFTFHFPLSAFTFPILTRRASKRQQRESEKRNGNGNREMLYLTSTRCTTRPGNQPQRR